MRTIRLVLIMALLATSASVAPAQDDLMGEAVGEDDEPIGGEEVGGEAVGEDDEPIGGEEVGGEAVGEEDEPIGGEPLD
jgi:hypothetical protein